MPTYTQHLNLIKPEPHDFYDVGVHNGNMDTLDRTVAELREENRLLHEELANKVNVSTYNTGMTGKADKQRITEYSIPISSDFEVYLDAYYMKNQFEEVSIVDSIQKIDTNFIHGETIATLPVGYRPRNDIEIPANYLPGHKMGLVRVYRGGALTVQNVPDGVNFVFFNVHYLAAQ